MNEDDGVLGWYEPYLSTVWSGRIIVWYDAKTIALGAIGFAAPIVVTWLSAGSSRMPLFKMLLVSLGFGTLLYLILPLTESLCPAYIKVSPTHLSRASLAGGWDLPLPEIKECRFGIIRMFGRSCNVMIVTPFKGKDLVIGISPTITEQEVHAMLTHGNINIEKSAPDA